MPAHNLRRFFCCSTLPSLALELALPTRNHLCFSPGAPVRCFYDKSILAVLYGGQSTIQFFDKGATAMHCLLIRTPRDMTVFLLIESR